MAKKIRTYSTAFKAEAVKKIADNNGNVSATAKQLGRLYLTGKTKLMKANLSALNSMNLNS